MSPEARCESACLRTAGGVELAFDRYGSGSDTLVVVSHGLQAHRGLTEIRRLAAHLAGRCDVVALDCRGHGESGGRFSFGRHEWRDLAEAVGQLRGSYRAVGGIGFSFGAFHTCVAAARAGCFDSVMLVSGPKSLWVLDHNPLTAGLARSLGLMLHRRRKRTRFSMRDGFGWRVTPEQCIGELRAPVHFVHGDADWLVSAGHSAALYEQARSPKRLTVLPGGLHAEYLLLQMPERFLPLVDEWLDTTLRPSDAG
jgi:uncharacterized protein